MLKMAAGNSVANNGAMRAANGGFARGIPKRSTRETAPTPGDRQKIPTRQGLGFHIMVVGWYPASNDYWKYAIEALRVAADHCELDRPMRGNALARRSRPWGEGNGWLEWKTCRYRGRSSRVFAL